MNDIQITIKVKTRRRVFELTLSEAEALRDELSRLLPPKPKQCKPILIHSGIVGVINRPTAAERYNTEVKRPGGRAR